MSDTNALMGIGGSPLDATETTNVATSLAGAGASFGELIKGVGKAVADTQLKLTENSAETTSTLAKTLVEVIAVQETIYDDEGQITGSESHVQKLPLLNFVDPAFYHYPQVKIEGHFVMDSFATDSSSSVDTAASTFGMGFSFSRSPGIFGLVGSSASGSISATRTSTSTDLNQQTNQASAVGHMRLYSQLKPEPGLGVPQPVQVIMGPSLAIIEGETTPDTTDAGGNRERTMSLLLQLRNKDGQAIAGKALSIGCEGAIWNFANPVETKTNADGDLAIKVKRVFPPDPTDSDEKVDLSPKPFTLNVRRGLVVNSITREL